MPRIDHLNDRQWVQIKAALTLWRTVASNSRVHPSRHSNIEPLFADSTPLADDELAILIESVPDRPFTTTGQFAKEAGVTPGTVRNWIMRGEVGPAFRHGNNCIYRTAELTRLKETYGKPTVHRD